MGKRSKYLLGRFHVLFVILLSSMVLLVAGCGGGSSTSKYSITYNGNGNTSGSVPTDSSTYQQGNTVTVLGNTGSVAKTGFSFAGWNTLANGSGTTYTVGQTFTMGTANVNLYAQWTSNSSGGYTVTYNSNGGTGSVPVDSNSYAGQAVTVPGNSGGLTYTGYSFVGWQTKADGSGTTYALGDNFTMGTANVTLYALWAGGYAYAVNHNDGAEGDISQYTIGPNGALTPMFTPIVPTGGTDTRYIAVDPSGRYIYVSNINNETVSQFKIGADGSLTPLSTPILMGDVSGGKLYYPEGIAVHPSGKYVYVTLQEKSSVNQYTIGTDGTLSAMTPSTVISGTGFPAQPDAVAIDPSGKWAYVANGGGATVSQYTIDQTTGALTPMSPATVATGSNAFDIKVASTTSGEYVYVTDYGSSTVWEYSVNSDGTLSSIGTVSVSSVTGAFTLTIAVHPTGKWAYVTMLAGTPDAVVAQLNINQSNGMLSLMSTPSVSAGGAAAQTFAIDPTGKYAYATSGETGWSSSTIAQYTIDQTTGALTLMSNPTVQTSAIGPSGIVIVGK